MRLLALACLTSLAVITDSLSAGQALAQQVSCGAIITQDTTLDSDLNNCPVHGIEIGANNITLDLGGHTIDGVGPLSVGNGVDNTGGYDGVTIKNGRIREFMNGVNLNNATQNRLRELRISYNTTDGISLSESDNNRIVRNRTSDNENNGIMVGNGSDGNRIDRNSSFDNENFGIAVEVNSNGNRITSNEANNNGHPDGNSGILVDDTSTGTLIESNVANRNKEDGITVNNAATTLRDNTADNNGDLGIEAVAGVIDGGGNEAEDNGNPLQCTNVVCQ